MACEAIPPAFRVISPIWLHGGEEKQFVDYDGFFPAC